MARLSIRQKLLWKPQVPRLYRVFLQYYISLSSKLAGVLQEVMDLSPRGIREHLQLNRPIFARTAAYGHFGRDPEPDGGFSWENCDLTEKLTSAV